MLVSKYFESNKDLNLFLCMRDSERVVVFLSCIVLSNRFLKKSSSETVQDSIF